MIEERATSDGGVIGLRIDITEMKEQAQALRQALVRAEAANKAKSDFLANMSHEIRTPLNGVLGLAGVLEQGALDPHQRDIVRTIIASANTLDVLLGDLLTFARLESGKLELNAAPFPLAAAVEETAALFQAQARDKGLELVLDLASEADAIVLGDCARLKQVLINLLSNALKFTAEGLIRVALTCEGAGPARRWRFVVSDTGIGFEPEDAARLFARFEQADSSITRRYGGTGLGLAICRQLAELMGGSIEAAGRPGRGASFTLELPLPLAPAIEGGVAAGATQPPPGLQILVAEDNPTNRKVAQLMLAAIGAQVDCVENGGAAVEAARRGVYDLALIDLQMPVMDGLGADGADGAGPAAPADGGAVGQCHARASGRVQGGGGGWPHRQADPRRRTDERGDGGGRGPVADGRTAGGVADRRRCRRRARRQAGSASRPRAVASSSDAAMTGALDLAGKPSPFTAARKPGS